MDCEDDGGGGNYRRVASSSERWHATLGVEMSVPRAPASAAAAAVGAGGVALPDIAAVVGVFNQIDGVVGGQGDVGQAADESWRVLSQRAQHDVVHATCGTRQQVEITGTPMQSGRHGHRGEICVYKGGGGVQNIPRTTHTQLEPQTPRQPAKLKSSYEITWLHKYTDLRRKCRNKAR